MYRTTGAGKEALPPAMMAMAVLVQGYLGISDAEMVELTVVDLRVQMVMGCLGTEAPAFSQGALQECRERLIAAHIGSPPARTHRRLGEARSGLCYLLGQWLTAAPGDVITQTVKGLTISFTKQELISGTAVTFIDDPDAMRRTAYKIGREIAVDRLGPELMLRPEYDAARAFVRTGTT
jgi:hypothetical protein